MYDINQITEALRPLIGFYQNEDPNGEQLDADLLTSESGLYFQNSHPLVTIRNLVNIAPDFALITYSPWNNTTDYKEGQKTAYSGINYIAIQDNTGQQPDTSPNDWKEYDAFSEWLRKLEDAAITEVVQDLLDEKQITRQSKSILEYKTLYNGVGRLTDTVENTDDFVSLDIKLMRSKGAKVVLNKIALQFDANIASLPIYIFHSSQQAPIYQTTLAYDNAPGVQWFDLEQVLRHFESSLDSGGMFQIGYYQSDLAGARAINKDVDWYNGPCSSCNKASVGDFKLMSNYIQVCASARDEEIKGELTDISKSTNFNRKNYGLNLEISVLCDVTSIIIGQKDIFKGAVYLKFAIMVLQSLVYNSEDKVNRNSLTQNVARITYDLDGTDESKSNSLNYRYMKAKEAINVSTQGLSAMCLRCPDNGVRYSSI